MTEKKRAVPHHQLMAKVHRLWEEAHQSGPRELAPVTPPDANKSLIIGLPAALLKIREINFGKIRRWWYFLAGGPPVWIGGTTARIIG